MCLFALIAVALASSCSENPLTGELGDNLPPTVTLTNGPIEGTDTQYRVRFYWFGDDPDGTIVRYELALVAGNPLGFNMADTMGADKWTRTQLTDTLIIATADAYDTTFAIDNNPYTRYKKTHTFFLRAIDDRGAVSNTIFRSFNAWTFAPHIFIVEPDPPLPAGSTQMLSTLVSFGWYGKDPIDSPSNYQPVDSVRFLCTGYDPVQLQRLNEHVEQFESLWSPWISYDAPGDSGRATIIGDDEVLIPVVQYMFAVQAKDEAGAVTSVFDASTNVRLFMPRTPTGPLIRVREKLLGWYNFIGTNLNTRVISIPPGFALNFSWIGDASQYGATVATYRYGWDISDLNNPAEWDVLANPYTKSCPTKKFFSGIHTLYVESVDVLGVKSLAVIEIRVFSNIMERSLLLVDDYPSSNFSQVDYAFPTEMEHDKFWQDVCLRVPGFNPSTDIYDVNDRGHKVPPMEFAWKYKNIIWVSNTALIPEYGSLWKTFTMTVPEWITNFNYELYEGRAINYLPYYLASGGHIWTCGESRRDGGLAATCGSYKFPQCVRSNSSWGLFNMARKEYCVYVLDKVEGTFYDLGYIYPYKERDSEYDAMSYGYLDDTDPLTVSMTGLPDRLELWERVTATGKFYDPLVRGFLDVEVYDPEYFMVLNRLHSDSCFHPMYRMMARHGQSVLHRQTVAFWTTKYADAVADAEGAVAAPSVHFGFPLWFFNRAQVDSIADVVFKTWNIK